MHHRISRTSRMDKNLRLQALNPITPTTPITPEPQNPTTQEPFCPKHHTTRTLNPGQTDPQHFRAFGSRTPGQVELGGVEASGKILVWLSRGGEFWGLGFRV